MKDDLTRAVETFHSVQQGNPVDHQAVALFHALLGIWVVRGKPEVFAVWRERLCHLSGLSNGVYCKHRATLAAREIIAWRDCGRAGHQYSLNPLLDKPEPDWAAQEAVKPSYEKLPDLINGLHESWKGMVWNNTQSHALREVASGFDDYPWELVREYYRINPQYLPRREHFVSDQGRSALVRANKEIADTPEYRLSMITGGKLRKPGRDKLADRLHREVSKGRITLIEARKKWEHDSNKEPAEMVSDMPG
jgi:hypothetical protein